MRPPRVAGPTRPDRPGRCQPAKWRMLRSLLVRHRQEAVRAAAHRVGDLPHEARDDRGGGQGDHANTIRPAMPQWASARLASEPFTPIPLPGVQVAFQAVTGFVTTDVARRTP